MTGEKLKSLRKKAGMTQEALAKELGTYKQHISAWENNKMEISRLYLKELKKVLKIED